MLDTSEARAGTFCTARTSKARASKSGERSGVRVSRTDRGQTCATRAGRAQRLEQRAIALPCQGSVRRNRSPQALELRSSPAQAPGGQNGRPVCEFHHPPHTSLPNFFPPLSATRQA